MTTEDRWDVVVIGAGLSGLIAARDLQEKGYRTLVLEGRDRPGGRTWTRNYEGTDHPIELGGTWISKEWMPAITSEVARYGIQLKDQEDCRSFTWITGGQRREHAPIPAEEFGAAEGALFAFHEAMARTPNGELREDEDYSDLDVPVSEWPPFTALPRASREFVFAWAAMYSGSKVEEVSVMHFSMMLAAFGSNVSALHFGLAQRFAHGTRSLVEALVEPIANHVGYSTRVTALEDNGDTVTVRTDHGEVTADRVVCTIPLNSLHRVKFSPELPGPMSAIVERGIPTRLLKSWAHCKNVPEGFLGVGWGTGFEWSMPLYTLADGTSLVCSFGHDRSLVDVTDPGSVQAVLKKFHPDIEVLSVDSHDWNADEFSDGNHMIVVPGWISSGDCHVFAKPHGAIHFAGSDHSLAWTGWMEGAVLSGRDAAARVHTELASHERRAS